MRHFVWLVLALAFVASCATTGGRPAIMDNPAANAKYPPDRYITATGQSTAGRAEAEADARVKIAEQINARIRGELTVILENYHGNDKQTIIEKIHQETQFKHAALINLDHESCGCYAGTHYVFAYLSRRQIAEVLLSEYQIAAPTFRTNAELLLNQPQDFSGFAAGLRTIRKTFGDLTGKAAELRAVTGRAFAPYEADVSRFNAVEDRRVRMLEDLKVTLEISDIVYTSETCPDLDLSGVREAVVLAVSQVMPDLGLTATSEVCGPQAYKLLVSPELSCGYAFTGRRCDLRLRLAMFKCDTDEMITTFDCGGLMGASSRDEAGALRSLMANTTARAVGPCLAAGLEPVVPINQQESE